MTGRFAAPSCLLSLALTLASCGSGGGGSTPVAPGTPVTQLATERFVVSIPHQSTSSRARAPRYISVGTQSVTLTVPNAAPVTVGLTPSNPNCAQSPSALVCTVDFPVPIGTTTVVVSTYASTDGGGTPLSTARLAITVVSGQINTLDVTLNPVVAGMSSSFASGGSLVVPGTPSMATLIVTPVDAAGSAIIGPGAYVDAAGNPVTIAVTDSDTSGATSVSPKSFGSPADGNTVTVNYNGAAIPNFTVTASVPNSIFTAQTFIVKPPGQVVYIGSYPCGISTMRSMSNIGEFQPPASGSTTLGTFLGSLTSAAIAGAIAVDRRGDVFTDDVVFVNRYAPNTVGTPPPAASVNLPANERSFAIAADSTGGFWVSAVYNSSVTSFLHYAANANGNVLPDRTVTGIAGMPAGYSLTYTGLALDSHDNIYVVAVSAGAGNPLVYKLAPNANGSAVAPIASIAFGATDDSPRLAVDQHTDTLWEYPVDVFNGSVKISSAGMSAVPNQTFPAGRLLYPQGTGDTFRPYSLAIDDAGNVYAVFAAGGPGGPCNSPASFFVWGPSAGGAVALPQNQLGSTFAVTIPPLTTP